MTPHFILLFITTVFVASIIPGPSMLLALTHGMTYGAKRTMISALGNVSVTLLQASVSFAGLGTLLIASETLFMVIKWAGALYLVYMGIGILFSTRTSSNLNNMDLPGEDNSLRKMFLQAALVTAGNPKAIIFFTAVFPQFVQPQGDIVMQFSVLMIIGALIAFICFMIYAIGGQKIMSLFSDVKIGKWIKRVIGGTFIAAGIGLAVSNK